MNRYQELQEMRAAVKADIDKIDAELKKMQPPELWVCYFIDDQYVPKFFTSESEAKAHFPSLVSKVVRYVLQHEAKVTEQPPTKK